MCVMSVNFNSQNKLFFYSLRDMFGFIKTIVKLSVSFWGFVTFKLSKVYALRPKYNSVQFLGIDVNVMVWGL